MAAAGRIPWIDNAKSLGIVLVVLGHAPALPDWAREFVYRFHMPLFFFLAGAVVKPGRLAEGLLPWVKRQARLLLVPYLFFWAVSTTWWLLIRNIGEKAKESAGLAWWSPVKGLFWGTGDFLFVNQGLWFFPAMFVTAVAGWGVWRLTGWDRLRMGVVLAVLAAMILLISGLWPHGLWWNLDLLPWMLFFHGLGVWLGPLVGRAPGGGAPWPRLACALVFLVVGWWVRSWPAFDLNGRLFGGRPSVALGCAAVMVLSFSATLGLFGEWRRLSGLARNTIIIFPLHGLCFSLFTGLLSLGLHAGGWSRSGGWAAALAYSAGAITLCLIAAPILRRWVPWAVGGGRA